MSLKTSHLRSLIEGEEFVMLKSVFGSIRYKCLQLN